jgi:hypothetical protein
VNAFRRALWLLAAGALASPAAAADLTVAGSVVTGPDRTPVAGVQVDLEVRGRLVPDAARTDAAGRFEARVPLPPGSVPASMAVAARYLKDGFDPLQAVEPCAPGGGPGARCTLRPAELLATAGLAALTEEEIRILASLRSAEGSTLYLLEYQVLPPGPSAPRIDPNSLAVSLRMAIATAMDDLYADPALADYDPLDAAGLVAVPPPVTAASPEKAKAVGERLNALGVVSGTGLLRGGGGEPPAVTMTSNLVLMPAGEERSRSLLVRDPEIPAGLLSSGELSARLSPVWNQSAFLAVCRREFARARAQQDRRGLERLRAYLIAERSRAGPGQGMQRADLDRLLRRVEQELGL